MHDLLPCNYNTTFLKSILNDDRKKIVETYKYRTNWDVYSLQDAHSKSQFYGKVGLVV